MKKTQTNGKITCVHGSEELILLKYPYYPKPSIDSTQFPSNTNGILYRNRKKKNPKICVEPQKTLNSKNNTEEKEQS